MKLELENNLTFVPEKGSTEGEQQVNFCNICQKRFVNAEDLKKHNKNHLFSCSECNQAFNDQITLTKHTEEAHSHDKNFHCTQCDKSFKELRTLRLHLKIHNADYPEHCEVCKKGFRTKWQLKQHLMDHGGKRPYPCPECSFTCKTKQQLNEHRRKHSGEKAYSCPLCGTRFTYRNGLIKHTKLNRCPKKIFSQDGEKMVKKKTKSGEHFGKQRGDSGGLVSRVEPKHRSEKSALDQKILDVLQKRSAGKGPACVELASGPGSVASVTSIDGNNNHELLRRASLHTHARAAGSVSLPPSLLSSVPGAGPGGGAGVPSGTTATFLTNSADISSWAATLPAGTKVTVTHYDASRGRGGAGAGQLVATPTHTETIIVTPPKQGGDKRSPPPPVRGPASPPHPAPLIPGGGAALAQCQPAFSESFAVDPNEILLKNKPIKQEPDSLPSYQEANFNLSKFKLCNLPPISPIDVQLTARALLMNVRPDPNFDPNLKIKKECSDHGSLELHSPAHSPERCWPQPSLNDIKQEVLEELFDTAAPGHKMEVSPAPGHAVSPPGSFLVPQLSVAGSEEGEDSQEAALIEDDFYSCGGAAAGPRGAGLEAGLKLKTEPVSPSSASQWSSGSSSDTDHDLDTIVATFGHAPSHAPSPCPGPGTKQDATLGAATHLGSLASCKADFNLPDLDLDFSNFFDENINDINMNEQDFLQMRMDTFDACSEIMSNV